MATRSPKVANLAQIAQQTEDAGVSLEGLLADNDINPALERIFGELGGDTLSRVTVYIYKIVESTGKEPRVWSGAPDDYDLTAIAKRFGSADYRVKIMGPNEEGKPVLKANQVVTMLLDPAEDQRIEAMRRGDIQAVAATPPAPVMGPAEIANMVIAAVKAAMPAPVDPFASFDRMAGAMQKLMPQQSAQQGMGIRDVIETARMLSGMNGNSGEPSGGEKPKDFAMNRGIALLEKMFMKHIENPAPTLPSASVATGHVPAVVVGADDAAALEQLRGYLRTLCQEAEKGTDAEKVAEFIYEDVPETLIAEMATNPEWFKIFTGNVSDCAKHSEWFFKLKDHLIAFAREDDLLTPEGHLRTVVGDGPAAT